MLLGIQILGILFALVMMYFTFLYYKRDHYQMRGLIVWMIIWAGMIVLVMFPQTIYGVMDTLYIERTVDFFIIGGFFVFSVILFHVYYITKKTEKKVEDLVRKIAMEQKRKKK